MERQYAVYLKSFGVSEQMQSLLVDREQDVQMRILSACKKVLKKNQERQQKDKPHN